MDEVGQPSDLVVRLKRREGYAIVLLNQGYAALAGMIILRLNAGWMTRRVVDDAVRKVMDIVLETIVSTPDHDVEDIAIRELVVDTACYIGLVLWRRFNNPDEES